MKTTRVTLLLATFIVCLAGVAWAQTEWVDHPDNPVIEPGEPGEWDSEAREVTGVVTDGSMYHLYFAGFEEGVDTPSGIGHATSSDGVMWTMDPNNPVLTPGAGGEWDEGGVYGIAVIYDNAEFHMWYGGWIDPWRSAAGYATSPDGSTWTKHSGNPVLEQGGPGSFDENGVFPRSVIFDGETYRMWYTGVNLPDFFFTVGYAESPDGISWTKHQGPVLETGLGWDSWDVHAPSVIFDGSIYHMWYSANGVVGNLALPTGIGYAVSGDGIEWFKHGDNPVIASGELWVAGGVVVSDGSTYHMWYREWIDDSPTLINYATSDCCAPPSFPMYIPAAAVASGAQGAFFKTDVDLSNRGSQPVEYQLMWLPRGANNSEPMTSETFTLGAGMSVRYANVLSEVFDLEPNSIGALKLMCSMPDLLGMSRTYNTPTSEPGGTFGQAMPAVAPGEMMATGERKRILFASENAEMRTNIGCQSASDGTTVVNVELFDSEGTSLERTMMILPSYGNDQLNRPFEDYAPVEGYVEVWTDVPNRQIYCYGSVLDNTTSDPTTIPPQ